MTAAVVEDLETARREVTAGVAAALDAMETALAELAAAPPAVDKAQDALMAAMQALSFDDLCGQRLDRAIALLTGRVETRPDAELLNGPARSPGSGQDSVDAIFGD